MTILDGVAGGIAGGISNAIFFLSAKHVKHEGIHFILPSRGAFMNFIPRWETDFKLQWGLGLNPLVFIKVPTQLVDINFDII